MAIEKLNLDWKNFGESGYENSKMNNVKMGDITDKIDEIIDNANTKMCVTQRITNCDANDLENYGIGMFVCQSVTANFPMTGSSEHYYLIQMTFNADYFLQVIVHIFRNPLQIHCRRKISGTWGEWEQIN